MKSFKKTGWNSLAGERINRQVAFVLLAALTGLQASAQMLTGEPIVGRFEDYNQERLQEKIYLHSDKTFYLAGEICWFKLYCVDASFHKPLDMSKVAYAELLNDKNKPVLQAKIGLQGGCGSGSFQLPSDLETGKYKMRGYTSWMKNFSASFFFEKEVTIVNVRDFTAKDSAKQKRTYQIRLFPEGGNLVNGIQSKLAFSVTDQNGKGISCEGILVDDQQDTLVKFKTLKFGLGTFRFTPEKDRQYEAVTFMPDGEQVRQKVPGAFNGGYVMHLEESGNNMLGISVRYSGNPYDTSVIYLFVQTRGMVKAVLSRQIQNGTAEFVLDKTRLGEGISQLTVFNPDRVPVCERLYFKFPENRLHVELKADKSEYSNREKINIQIGSARRDGLPIGSNLSVAVYQLDSLQELEEMNIENYLFLSSDLPGKIESPGYYFTNEGNEKEEAMDNLMLTKGWRRFRWEDIRQNRKPAFEFVPEYVGHIVKAKVTDSATGVPVRGISAYLSTPGTRPQFRTAISDSAGMLHFDMKDFYSDGELILQARDQREGLLSMEVLDPFSHHYSDPVISDFSRDHISQKILMNHQVALKVQNQYVRNRLNHFQMPEIDTVPFYGKPDFSYLLDDYVRFTTIEEVLREYVAPITVTMKNGKYAVKVFDANREHVAFESDPLVLLNGVPVFDFSRIISYDPMNVRKLDIITRTYFYGNMAFDGIMNFVGYNGQIQGFELDPHSTVVDYEGLQERREFYSPVYETEQEVVNRLPDFRTLLYWTPDIKTTSKGEMNLSFYSSDLSGRYAVVLQGISPGGQPVNGVTELVVREKSRK